MSSAYQIQHKLPAANATLFRRAEAEGFLCSWERKHSDKTNTAQAHDSVRRTRLSESPSAHQRSRSEHKELVYVCDYKSPFSEIFLSS
jgi:hypothetical protein